MDKKYFKTDFLGSVSYSIFMICMMLSFAFYLFDDADNSFYIGDVSIFMPILILVTIIVAVCSLAYKRKHLIMNFFTVILTIFSAIWVVNSSGDLRTLGVVVFVSNLILLISITSKLIIKRNSR